MAMPFSVGDWFIFLFPGGAFLATVSIVELWAGQLRGPGMNLPFHDTLDLVRRSLPEGAPALSAALMAALLLALAFTLGHMIAGFGAILLERILIFKGVGWPYRLLLDRRRRESRWTRTSRSFYRGAFISSNVAVALFYLGVAYCPAGIGRAVSIAIPSLIGLLVLIASGLKLRQSRQRKDLTKAVTALRAGIKQFRARPVPEEGSEDQPWHMDERFDLCRSRDELVRQWSRLSRQRVWTAMLAAPWEGILNPLVKVYGTKAPLHADVRRAVVEEVQRRSPNLNVATLDSYLFWYPYLYVVENARALRVALLQGRRQYRFIRNLSAAFYLSFLWCFFWLWRSGTLLDLPAADTTAGAVVRALPIAAFLIAGLCLVRYFFLFFTVFHDLVFRAFLVATTDPGRGRVEPQKLTSTRWHAPNPAGTTAKGRRPPNRGSRSARMPRT